MNRLTRRIAVAGALATAALFAAAPHGQAAGYPEKPIRVIIPIAPGGQTDVLARLLQQTIDKNKLLPQPLVIVNNAAAGGSAGTRTVRDAEADGYTIGMFHMGLLTAPAMGVVDYDHTAFEMIGQVGRTPVGLGVLASSRFKTIQDLVAEAKAKPDTVTVAMNIGLLPHFVPLMFQQDAGIRLRYVQSGGGAVRLKSLLGNHTEVSLFASSEFVLYKDQGIKPLVMFSETRVSDLPDVPTAREIGIKTVFEERVMAFAPKGTPRDRIEVVAKALQAALDDPEVVSRLAALGIERQFIDGPKLRATLDQLKGPIVTVGEEVRKAQAEQAAGEKKQ
ncbi:tripartite tricarboxylate transporter substrate binding protein [Alsobacter sp. R-9]